MNASDIFSRHFNETAPALPGAALPWLADRRQAGLSLFADLGLPTQRAESWRYTSLRALEREILTFDPRVEHMEGPIIDSPPSLLPGDEGVHRLVFVNGRFHPALSTLEALPEGALLETFAAALERDGSLIESQLGELADGCALTALNTALMTDGVVLSLQPGVVLHTPIEIIHLGGVQEKLSYHPRNLFLLAPGAKATVVEHHRGLGPATTLCNSVTEARLAEGALLRHYKLQNEGAGAFHLSSATASVAKDASYDAFTLSIGARLSRNEVRVELVGEGGSCHVNGAYLMRGRQHCDNTTEINHRVPNTSCREVFKGVIDDSARAVFQGRIVVHPGAQGTNGHQLSKALLLSDKAEIDQKPELEILADDVLCSHGATAGDLDHDALFYLRSRGIPAERAQSILIESFLSEAVSAIAAEGLCPALMTSIGHWLADR